MKNHFKWVVILGVLFFGGLLAQEKSLVVGTTSGYAPFASLNDKGEYEGFDIDVAELLSKKLGVKLEIRDCGSMPSLMMALQQKKVDALLWAISITEERQKRMDMIHYQGKATTELPFLFWKEIPSDISSIEDLGKDSKRVVCIEAGTLQEGVLREFPNVHVKYLDKISDAVLEIKYGKSTTTAIDPALVPRFQEQYPELKVLYLKIPEKRQAFGHGVCLNKGNKDLGDKIRKAIGELVAEGKIGELEKKWGLN